MRIFRTEVWSYAVLLVILFCLAAVAVLYTLGYIEQHVPAEEFKVINAAMWALTMGFMFVAGAFGLWAIQFAGEAEGRRRVGRLVDAMDYLRDGLLVLDTNGRISGSNPAARRMSGSQLDAKERIDKVFNCLSDEDLPLLLDDHAPNEVEREISQSDGVKVWRFRSQPAEDMSVVLISDVTRTNAKRMRSRQAARLQLIGEIAKGVAHDFNNLLCGISGYASLLGRMKPGSDEAGNCASAITKSVERGIAMAGHLLTLSKEGVGGKFTDMVPDHIEAAAAVLRDSLPEGWKVETRVHGRIPPVALTGIQVEQLVANLGFVASDSSESPAVLRIEAGGVDMPGILRTETSLAGVLIIGVIPEDVSLNDFTRRDDDGLEYGVIESVLKSTLQESGGNLETVFDSRGDSLFRVSLPMGNISLPEDPGEDLPDELKAYVAGWNVLLAAPGKAYPSLQERMVDVGLSVTSVDSIAALLAGIEQMDDLDMLVIDERILGAEPKGILRAVIRLRPSAGLILLCEDPDSMSADMTSEVLVRDSGSAPERVVSAMIEAKTLAAHRL